MNTKKSHVEKSQCPIAHALDIIGDRWTLIVIRDIMFLEKHEFGEFLDAPERISTNILTDRLKKLTQMGVIGLMEHPANKTKKLYYLTEMGIDLIHVIIPIILWAQKHLATVPNHPILETIQKDSKSFIMQTIEKIRKWNKENISVS